MTSSCEVGRWGAAAHLGSHGHRARKSSGGANAQEESSCLNRPTWRQTQCWGPHSREAHSRARGIMSNQQACPFWKRWDSHTCHCLSVLPPKGRIMWLLGIIKVTERLLWKKSQTENFYGMWVIPGRKQKQKIIYKWISTEKSFFSHPTVHTSTH